MALEGRSWHKSPFAVETGVGWGRETPASHASLSAWPTAGTGEIDAASIKKSTNVFLHPVTCPTPETRRGRGSGVEMCPWGLQESELNVSHVQHGQSERCLP